MKNTITAIALALASLTASAVENWVHVSDGDDGARLIVDAGSFLQAPGDGTHYLGANFRFVADGKMNPVFIYVIEQASCKNGSGELYARVKQDGKWVTRDTYFWSNSGTKMYDYGARALCTILEVVEEAKGNTKGKAYKTL